MKTKIINIVWFGTLLFLILCFTRLPIVAQKVMLSPELRIMGDRLIEKNDSGYIIDQVYELGNPGEPGFKRVLYIYRINTNYETVATFDYKTDCRADVEYIDHFYFKSNIVVLIKRKVPKSKDVEIAAILVDKLTLKKTSEKVLSFTSNEIKTCYGLETGSNDKFFFVKFGGRNSSAHFEQPEGVTVEAPIKRVVYTPELKEIDVDTKQMSGRRDYTYYSRLSGAGFRQHRFRFLTYVSNGRCETTACKSEILKAETVMSRMLFQTSGYY